MKRISVAVAVLLIGLASLAFADDMPGSPTHKSIALGFHHASAPIGLRWWLGGQKIGIDLGVGFSSTPASSDPDESVSGSAIDLGVPMVMHSWSRAHLMFRPGLLYESQEVGFGSGPTFDTVTQTTMSLLAELEAEIYLVDNVSVSASHGFAFTSVDSDTPGSDSQSSFGTFGNNFTEIGFHVYFLGGGR